MALSEMDLFGRRGKPTSNKPHKFVFDLYLNSKTINQNLAIRFNRNHQISHENVVHFHVNHHKRLPLFLPLLVPIISLEDQSRAEAGEESPFHNPYTEGLFLSLCLLMR